MTSGLSAAEREKLSAADVEGILEAHAAAGSVSRSAVLRASNADKNDFFDAVAISGDTVIVGAPYEDSKARGVGGKQTDNSLENSGAAYVFVRSGNSWVQQAYLKASNPGEGDEFGFSVAISGDTIVVGAFREDSISTGVDSSQANDTAPDAGAAYVFKRKAGKWKQQAYLKADKTVEESYFGYSVAISGDTVVVGGIGETGEATGEGSSQEDTTLELAGAAYVFTRTTSKWTQQAHLTASSAGKGDLFGISVAISGDTLVVGASGESSNATGVDGVQENDTLTRSGAAYIFERNGTTWAQDAYLKASNSGAGDLFGRSVAISEGLVVVGAYREDSGAGGVNNNKSDNLATDSGAAYVFSFAGKKWKQNAYLKPRNPEKSAGFGISVAISDGTVVVGAYGEDGDARGIAGQQTNLETKDFGAAYVFVLDDTKWRQKTYLKASNPGTDDLFGYSVAIDNGVTVISASGVSKSAGAVYLFEEVGIRRPEIVIKAPKGLVNGKASIAFGNFTSGSAGLSKTFTVSNMGVADLTGLAVTLDGTDAASYLVDTTGMSTTLLPGGSTTFAITFTPGDSATSVNRQAAIHVASNDKDESVFNIALTGLVLSTTADKDNDGLNDWAEVQYETLGFDWETSNTDLVAKLKAGANAAGLFTATDIQTLNVSAPLLTRDATGKFKLTLGVEKSVNLSNFTAFPMTSAETAIIGGKLEFQFTSPDAAAFYRVQVK